MNVFENVQNINHCKNNFPYKYYFNKRQNKHKPRPSGDRALIDPTTHHIRGKHIQFHKPYTQRAHP